MAGDGSRWAKGSASNTDPQGNCVELARSGVRVLVRSSRNPGERLAFPGSAWASFLERIRPIV
ncbi:DUF397 domain-containing protein [Saccharothrix obliqua]|uniref:DUF397 domain-containing protein n=1 Tax=Saccharothrix obliqua TaxID=2861747 RepID=UPI001C5D253B|nr:DUF397 domain-containing protein [Saccharothrix obliqua]MBW4717555.1 DUF397 domain-containing protein [Saccharothrix obliqua]